MLLALLFLTATGLHARFLFSLALVDQALLLAHMVLGCAVVLLLWRRPRALVALTVGAAVSGVAGWGFAHALFGLGAVAVACAEAGSAALAPALAVAVVMVAALNRAEPPRADRPVSNNRNARSSDGRVIPVERLARSESCRECHSEIHDEWSRSMHRHSASHDHYVAQAKLRVHDTGDRQFCGSCHEPVAVLSGRADAPESRAEGVSCLACHRVEALHHGLTGNGSIVVAEYQPYMMDALVRAKPDVHREDLMRPLLRKSEFCAGCHQMYVDTAHGYFKLQTTFDEWKMSRFAETKRCQDCHMPMINGHRSHEFPGANTARPYLDGDARMLETTRKFLTAGDVRVLLAAQTGRPLRLKVTVENLTVGHKFPTGATDTHDVWVELEVRDARGGVVHHSGALGDRGDVDPNAYFFNSRAVDEDGEWLHRRDLWNLAGFQHKLAVFPGTFNFKFYEMTVPPGTPGPLTAVAKLNHRKYNQAFTRFVFGRGPLRAESGYTGRWTPDVRLPVTQLSRAEATIPLAP